MGLYDTVHASCPKCGVNLEFQSKAGKCELRDYGASNGVPPAIAADLDGEVLECAECRTRVVLEQLVPVSKIRMVAVVKRYEDEDD